MRTKLATLAFFFAATARAEPPDCTGRDRFPARFALDAVVDAGLAERQAIDLDRTEVVRLASGEDGKDHFTQVHDIRFFLRTGGVVEVITVNPVSSQECSMGEIEVLLVSRRLE